MSREPRCVALLAGLVCLVVSSQAFAATRVAVVEFTGLGLDPRVTEAFARYLSTSLGTIAEVSVVSAVDLEIALESPANRTVATCGGGPKCAAKVAKLVGADVAVFGTISSLGQNYSLNLRALDVQSGRALERHVATIAGSKDRLIPEVRLAAFKLIAPDKIRGSLHVDIAADGVVVEIDGKALGVTPLDNRVASLAPGRHVVVLKKSGYSEWQHEFDIKPFETARLKTELKRLD